MSTPVIYDLRNDADAARFGLTPAERNRLLNKCNKNRNGARPRKIVLHIQEGNTTGSLDWWANNVSASATVLVTKKGEIVRCIPEAHGPWTNGDVINPTAKGKTLTSLGPDPNNYSLTVEAEGMPWESHPQAEIDAIAWQCRQWMTTYGLTIDDILRHSDINSSTVPPKGRAQCPGPYYDRVIAALKSGSPASPVVPPQPVDPVPYAAFFGTVVPYDPEGPVSRFWKARGDATGKYPELRRIVGWNGSTFYQFSNGMTLEWRDGVLTEVGASD